jgi:hypothetical protein
MEKTAEATFASGRLVYLDARLNLLRGTLERIRDHWKERDIQELRDELEEQWSSAGVLPLWAPLYEARRSANGKAAEVQRSIRCALDAVEALQRNGDGELPRELVGDWSAFTNEYRVARAMTAP